MAIVRQVGKRIYNLENMVRVSGMLVPCRERQLQFQSRIQVVDIECERMDLLLACETNTMANAPNQCKFNVVTFVRDGEADSIGVGG